MNIKIILLVVGLLVVVGGVGVYVMSMGSQAPQEVTATDVKNVPDVAENKPAEAPAPITGKDSIMALEAMGKDLECDFEIGEGDARTSGTGFFSKGNVRVDTVLKGGTEASPDAAYMIMNKDSDSMYTWSQVKGETQGIKMSLKQITNMSSSTTGAKAPTRNPNAVSPESAVSYNCKPWTVDASVFVPPTDVKFMDMNNMNAIRDAAMKQAMQKNMQ